MTKIAFSTLGRNEATTSRNHMQAVSLKNWHVLDVRIC